MKLGLMTAAFPALTLEQVAEWSAANGFEISSLGDLMRHEEIPRLANFTFDGEAAPECRAGDRSPARSRVESHDGGVP